MRYCIKLIWMGERDFLHFSFAFLLAQRKPPRRVNHHDEQVNNNCAKILHVCLFLLFFIALNNKLIGLDTENLSFCNEFLYTVPISF